MCVSDVQGSLFEKIGEAKTVNAVLDTFCHWLHKDDRINGILNDDDIYNQRNMIKGFIFFAFDGPTEYHGKDLCCGHGPLVTRGLNELQFEALTEDLTGALKEEGIAPGLIEEVADCLNRKARKILLA